VRRMRQLSILALALLLCLFFPTGAALAQSTNEWREQRTDHFAILYTAGSEPIAQQYAGFVDELYDEVAAIFGHRVAVPVTLRLYPTLERYYEANPLARGLSGIVAHADFRRNEVVVIVPQTRNQTAEEVENNVRHELAHIVAAELSGNRLNVGFQEGVAQYVERPAPELETKVRLLRQAFEQGALLAWSDFDDRDRIYAAPDIAYPQTLSVVAFLVERSSFATLREFLAISAQSSGFRSALERTFGASPTTLENEWRAWLPSYLDGGYRRNALSAYDLGHVEQLLTNGQYEAARQELETAIDWLRTTSQLDVLQQAEALLRHSEAGLRADGLAAEARAALEAADYERAGALAREAQAVYTDIGDTRQDAALNAYGERAARGSAAAQILDLAHAQAADWRTYAQARAAADRAASEYVALGDRERAAEALALRGMLDQRQTLFGAMLLAVGAFGALLSLFRRATVREAEAW
jgi:hypothetical protein